MSSPSNDLLADRRFAWANALASDGDFAAAADLLEQVIERVPDWAPGWAALAEARESCNQPADAVAAWTRAAALDFGRSLGADLHLARLSGLTPDAMADDYVQALFNHYAPRFERHLVEDLAYRGPALLIGALDRVAPRRSFPRTLDLGCGTGLMGRGLANRSERIDGIDLSPVMIELARRSDLYAELSVASLDAALASGSGDTYDLVTAADVLVYVGDLAPLFAGVYRQLRPGGLLVFTAQTLNDDACGHDVVPNPVPLCRHHSLAASDEAEPMRFALGRDLRFGHSPDYVAATLSRGGFDIMLLERGLGPKGEIRSGSGTRRRGI